MDSRNTTIKSRARIEERNDDECWAIIHLPWDEFKVCVPQDEKMQRDFDNWPDFYYADISMYIDEDGDWVFESILNVSALPTSQ